MKKIFVNEVREGDFLQSTFVVSRHEMRTSRDGKPYLRLSLEDRTGSVEGRAWTDPETLAQRVATDDFAAVRGEVVQYDGRVVVEITDLEHVPDEAVDPRDYFPASHWPADAMFEQLAGLLDENLRSDAIRAFLDALLTDEDLVSRFKIAPAAMSNHHAYRGGLLEHCLSMCRVAVDLGAHYEAYYPGLINTDLLLAGVILHDFAKIWELSYRRSFDYTTPGRLVGHIPMGAKLVGKVAQRSRRPISEDLQMHLEHLVLSHHGEREYGAAQTPKTPEAVLLHQIDMIDSRMNMLWNEMQATKVEGAEESWSEFRRSLGDRILFRGRNSIDWDVTVSSDRNALDGPGLRRTPDANATTPMTLNLFDDEKS